jgi:hypothetical protein
VLGVVRDHGDAHGYGASAEWVSSVYLVWEKQGGPTQVARKREHEFSIGERQPNGERLSAP